MPEMEHIFNVPMSLVTRHYDDGCTLPPYRSEFMRDRDRLMYATAFRRLAGKTQIYTVGSDDHKKNRLTHTLEVAQIARTISIALKLNPDLAEAIALGHDFGHTPFGHAGEEMLHQIMVPNAKLVKESPFFESDLNAIQRRFERENPDPQKSMDHIFGFKHNLQSVRVCAMLEDSYRGENNQNIGLNLTNYTLYGMMTHSSLEYRQKEYYPPNFQNYFADQLKVKNGCADAWSFEAYIVKWADDFAQWHHDLEDAMREGVLPIEKICKTIEESLQESLNQSDRSTLQGIKSVKMKDRHCIAELSHIVVNALVTDLVETTRNNLDALSIVLSEKEVNSAEQFFSQYDYLGLPIPKENVVAISENINSDAFKGIIRASIHHSRNVERMNEKGKYIIRKLFEAYYAHPQQLPDGPILHWLVETHPEKYPNIDIAKEAGIGEARIEFQNYLKNPKIYEQCLLMRRICDHIASMTDHYAIEEYNNLYG